MFPKALQIVKTLFQIPIGLYLELVLGLLKGGVE